jgi:CBS domain-containing protein
VTEQIEADLANHGLMTVPDFRAVSLDTMVRLAVLPGPDEADGSPETEQPEGPDVLHFATRAPSAELVEEETRDVGRTLGNVLADDHRLVFVEPSATIQEAVTSMLLYDFSQLPVLAGQRQLRGAATWKSIAQARQRNARASLSDAIVPARDFFYDTRLLDVLDVLLKEDFVFVRALDNRLYGIVTAADVVRVYDDLATPFFLIGEVDQELRRLIRNTFDLDDVQRACASAPHCSRSTI